MAETTKTYLPAFGRDIFLPLYDPLTKLLGIARDHGALARQAELRSGHRVLDLGCGTGTLIVRLKEGHPHVDVVGLDPDPKALARARRKALRAGVTVRIDQGFADALPYDEGSFDRVFSSFMFHHLDEADGLAAFREVRRVLAPGGRLELVDFGGRHDAGEGRLHRLLHRQSRLANNDAERILALMREAGLARARVVARRDSIFAHTVQYEAARD